MPTPQDPEDAGYNIGIELEVYFKLHGDPGAGPTPRESREKFAKKVASSYNENLLVGKRRLEADWSDHPGRVPNSPASKGLWCVTEDLSIPDHDHDKGRPLEFISPILCFDRHSKWRNEVVYHWKRLLELGQPSTNDFCATHVHISPKATKFWSLDHLKNVAQAVVYFEEAFEVIIAPSRRTNGYSRSNKANNRKLKLLTFPACWEKIQACDDIDELTTLMQPLNYEPIEGLPDRAFRNFAWNFLLAKRDEIGTVEFRAAPGVLDGVHSLIWVELAVAFVHAAAAAAAAAQNGTPANLTQYASNIEGLKMFILNAADEQMFTLPLLEIVFHGHKGTKEPKEKNGSLGKDVDKEMRESFDERIKQLAPSLVASWE